MRGKQPDSCYYRTDARGGLKVSIAVSEAAIESGYNNSRQNFLIKLQLLFLFFYPLFWLGIGNKFPWVLLGKYGIDIGNSTFFFLTACFFLLLWVAPVNGLNLYRENIFKGMAIIASLFIVIYDIIQYKHFAHLGYQSPKMAYLLDVINIGFILLLLKKKNISWLYYWCCLFFMAHLALSVFYFPLNPLRSNMLTGIQAAMNAFLSNQDPYLLSSKDLVPYLPLTWAAFIPGKLLALDLRIVGDFYYALCLILIGINFKKLPTINKYLVCLWLLNPYFLMRHDLYFQLFLLEIVIFALYIHRLPRLLLLIMLGAFIATLQFAWILYPFFLLAISKSCQQLIMNLCISIASFLLLMWVFLGHFFSAYIAHSIRSAGVHGIQDARNFPYNMDITFGVSPIYHFAQNQHSLHLLQLTLCALLGLFAVVQWYRKADSNFLAFGLYAYLIFIATNYFLETYFYVPVLLLGALI